MASSTPPASAKETVSEGSTQSMNTDISMKDRFFRYFQHEVTALQDQMARLGDTAVIGGERSDAMDHCLAGISRLSSEVKDASSYLPTYDQQIYAKAIKALQEKLAATKESIAPRTKFAFKTARKNPSAVSLADAAELAAHGRRHVPGYSSNENSSIESSVNPSPSHSSTPANESSAQKQTSHLSTDVPRQGSEQSFGGVQKDQATTQKTSSPAASMVSVNSHSNLHIVLPTSTSQTTLPASITSLKHCVVDMSIPTSNGKHSAGLAVKNVAESLLVCGQVHGAAHITGVKRSVIVVSCHQFRMHDCSDVDVYLNCSSNPIIEDCSGIRFGKIPEAYILESSQPSAPNRWDKVEDFKWIKNEPNPNWRIMDESSIVPENVWTDVVLGERGSSLDEILKATGVVKL